MSDQLAALNKLSFLQPVEHFTPYVAKTAKTFVPASSEEPSTPTNPDPAEHSALDYSLQFDLAGWYSTPFSMRPYLDNPYGASDLSL
ncbi:hypothetical protein IAT38_005853 [Cryptococcus sp. DSM 104549]